MGTFFLKYRFGLIPFLSIWIFLACSNSTNTKTHEAAKGGRIYGGCLRTAETDPVQTLFPASITDATSAFIASQIYDRLVKFNELNLKVEPALAEKWEILDGGKKYRFFLHKDAVFHDDACFSEGKGRKITSQDVKYSFEILCRNTPENQNFSSTFKGRVLGADRFFESGKGEVEGFKIIDEYTFEIQLLKPNVSFLQILCQPTCAIIAKEAVEKYGISLRNGSGAFFYDSVHSDESKICLSRNSNYYGSDSLGNKLPFLDSVLVYIVDTKTEELKLFTQGKLDMITSLPSASVKEIVETQIKDFTGKNPKYRLDNSPEMITQFYTFNTRKAPFDNLKVRQALNYAIDRQKIVDDILAGQAYGPGIHGITPPTFSKEGFDYDKIIGYEYKPDLAKKLLKEAGYPDGKEFPNCKIVLNSGGARNSDVVIEIQKQLKENLNIELDFYVIPSAQKLEDSRYGKAEIIRDAWVADYPSPESFLGLFFGKIVPEKLSDPSFPNTSRFVNEEFDQYYELGRDASSVDSSMNYFMKADQILMNYCPLMVLWYEGSYKLTNNKLKNSYSNAMQYRNFSEAYFVP